MCFTGMRAVGVCAVSELLEKRLMLDAWVTQNGNLTIWNVVGEQDAANRIIVRPHPNKAGALQALINGKSHILVPPSALRGMPRFSAAAI